jgi:hypothetical protein
MVATRAGGADLGEAGQAAGQLLRVDLAVPALPLAGVLVQLGLGGGEQPDLGLDLGGQFGEGDGRVVAVQLEGGAGRGQPLFGPGDPQVPMGGLGDHPDQPGASGSDQRVRVGPAFQDGQVGLAELAGQGLVGSS